MILRNNFKTGSNDHEVLPSESSPLPYICIYADYDYTLAGHVPWHWHEEVEIDYIADGDVLFSTADQEISLHRGDVIFINSSILHTITVSRDARYYSHLFNVHFLSGIYGSGLDEKYFTPVLRSKMLRLYRISPDTLEHLKMVEYIANATDILEREPFGYEFEVRTLLDRFWCMLFSDTEELRSHEKVKTSQDDVRIKQMIQFINLHLADRVSLEQIAAQAGISKREATRCFSRTIGQTPVAYLESCRIRMAIDLLQHTDRPIARISEECGFQSPSYFSKAFREATGSTPREYRSQIQE